MMEELNNKNADFLPSVRSSNGSTLIQYAAKAQLDEVVSYLSVICSHEELSAEDSSGFNPLLYYLCKDNYEMASKLVFRGANVNHLYQLHGGKPAVAIMVEQKNDLAVKFLLDKLANPHLVFGYDNKDACDLAKLNGLDKRFYVFSKCNGESKIYPKDPLPGSIRDHHKDVVMNTTDFNKILESAKQLDKEKAAGRED